MTPQNIRYCIEPGAMIPQPRKFLPLAFKSAVGVALVIVTWLPLAALAIVYPDRSKLIGKALRDFLREILED